MKNDTLGQLCKDQEISDSVIHPADKAIYVRIDGRSFSRVTKNSTKPHDEVLIKIMQETTESLVKEFRADVGFCQSDEISLVFFPRNTERFSHLFGGKQQKLTSVIASHATYAFLTALVKSRYSAIDLTRPVTFDCRTVSCSVEDALLHLLWRHQDACRNAIQATAQHIVKWYNAAAEGKIIFQGERWNYDFDALTCLTPGSFSSIGRLANRYSMEIKRISLNDASTERQLDLIRFSGFPWRDTAPEKKYGTVILWQDNGEGKAKTLTRHSVPKIYLFLAEKLATQGLIPGEIYIEALGRHNARNDTRVDGIRYTREFIQLLVQNRSWQAPELIERVWKRYIREYGWNNIKVTCSLRVMDREQGAYRYGVVNGFHKGFQIVEVSEDKEATERNLHLGRDVAILVGQLVEDVRNEQG